MPRKTKTPKVAVTSPGQPYGVAGEQKAAMDIVPMAGGNGEYNPDMPVSSTESAQMLNPSGDTAGMSSGIGSVLEAALQTQPPGEGAFSAPSNNPEQTFQNTPIPAAPDVRPTNPTIDTLEMMARNMGNDPALMEMANQMRLRGY